MSSHMSAASSLYMPVQTAFIFEDRKLSEFGNWWKVMQTELGQVQLRDGLLISNGIN